MRSQLRRELELYEAPNFTPAPKKSSPCLYFGAVDCADFFVQLPGSSDFAASFEFEGEDHTLGNALRYIIMKKYAQWGFLADYA